ncbi:hypothetical protein 7S2_9 [uncultured Caudovirales phage]|uniref:Uncharacterized protein n=1 Tax=uncultured Caudovirales phage TaxID=2100421 RepID=A0A2H4J9R5_9CAUD|nr:hypothetical protein 7S2_9 [uncultured Caudovirales phage]
MTNIDLDQLERFHLSATPGPWEWIPNLGPTAICGHEALAGEFVAQKVSPADTRLIVESRNQLPAVVAALREARATIERVRMMAARHRYSGASPLALEILGALPEERP